MSNQSLRQASVRAVTGTTGTYNEDWHALFTVEGIAAGPFNQRFLAWINARLGVTYTNLNDAMAAFAADEGATNFGAIGTFDASGLAAPTLTWDGEGSDLTPGFAIDFPAPEVGDVVTLRRSTSVGFGTYDDATDTIDTIAPVNALTFDFGGNWTAGTWYAKTFYTRGATDSADSNVETLILASSYTPTFHFVGF